ncbi:MAG: right-handed parallel beta-helix repeat-containing protein [Duncaniella sp.]|nr:right-handed parallel beta-helix repeat-containing protein [Duncaniella sp.]
MKFRFEDLLKLAVVNIAVSCFVFPLSADVLYMAPDGDDSASGAIDAPLATFPAAYARMEGGDTLYFRGGTYHVTDGQVMKYDKNYAYVFALEKAGTPGSKTCFMGYPGERPVFDFSALQLDGRHRFAAFYLGADNLHLRNFDIVGVPVRVLGHTQSECVAARKGSDCIVENIAMHDGMAIGYYQTAGSNNLVLNCDAYNNYDDYSEGAYGGNVDGFGFHLGSPEYTGNVIRNCRAWRNSDDGFDLINCKAPVEIDHCWAFYNGFKPTANPADTVTFESAGDGNGFKAGGYGMKPGKTKCPDIVPRYYIHHCVAYHNKANGLYSNHHLGGSRWENNSSWDNRGNYNMVNRKSEREVVDVPGYGHELTGNVSYTYADGMRSGHLVNCDMTRSSLVNNSFAPADSAVTVTGDMFVSVDPAELFLPRDADGNLPRINFLRAKTGSPIAARHQGWAAEE